MESSGALEESLLLNLTVLCSLQRKRHYWRLDSKCLTLFQNESGSKYYKVKISHLLKICTLKYCVFSKYIQVIFINCYIGLQLLQLCVTQFLEVTVKFLVKASILYPSISPLATALLPKFFFSGLSGCCCFPSEYQVVLHISGCLAILNKGLDPCIRKDNQTMIQIRLLEVL